MGWEKILKVTLETIVIEEEESIHSFAKKVAEVLERDYGTHNYEPFFKPVRQELNELERKLQEELNE